jgi:hypothetical protein
MPQTVHHQPSPAGDSKSISSAKRYVSSASRALDSLVMRSWTRAAAAGEWPSPAGLGERLGGAYGDGDVAYCLAGCGSIGFVGDE